MTVSSSTWRRVAYAVVILVFGFISEQHGHGQSSCGPTVNPIACENLKPGTPSSVWDVSGAGDTTIQGFATAMSVTPGQTEQFKVDTTASAFTLDIYRLGYYNGNGAHLVATVTPTTAKNQSNCLTDPASGLIDCGNWTVSASWTVPADAVSGIYFAQVLASDNGGASHIFFVVRESDTASHHSDVVIQTSDTTWQAYNQYGGNSLYVGGPGTSPGRAYKVSYNRPLTTAADTAGQDCVFNAEYPMVRWLEANGYDVSYISGVDTDRSGALLLQHKLFLSVGHDEYWSGAQRSERRSGARRRRQPGVLQRQRGLLEDALGKQHRRNRHAVPDAGLLQGDARERGRSTRRIRRRGPARGRTRASARPPTAAGPRTR